MRKSTIFIIIIIIIILALIGWWIYSTYSYNKAKFDQDTVNAERLSSEITVNSATAQNATIANQEVSNAEVANAEIANKEVANAQIANQEAINAEVAAKKAANPTETEIASCSTKLLDKSSGRLSNIKLTCSAINGKKVSAGETFSFNSVVGKPTEEKGYKKASVISNGKSVQDIGGGNCQVSSTLYDAVLKAKDLKVLERHEHGKDVAYVDDGKDATISYGLLDFRFKNNASYDIKIYTSTDGKKVTARLVKLTY